MREVVDSNCMAIAMLLRDVFFWILGKRVPFHLKTHVGELVRFNTQNSTHTKTPQYTYPNCMLVRTGAVYHLPLYHLVSLVKGKGGQEKIC